MDTHQKPGVLKSLFVAIGVIAVIAVFVVGLGAAKLPYWPFIYFLFTLTMLSKVTKEGWVDTSLGIGIGLVVSLSSILLKHFLGDTIGLVGSLVLVVLLLTGQISGKFKYANLPCIFTLTAVSAFTTTIEYAAVGGIFISFFVGVVIMGVVVLALTSAAKKKASQSVATHS